MLMTKPAKTRARTPLETALIELDQHSIFMEHRDGQTLFWGDEWWEPGSFLGSIPGEATKEAGEAWAAGFRAGQEEGRADGERAGFAACQAGFRALLGAASANDVATLLHAAGQAGPR